MEAQTINVLASRLPEAIRELNKLAAKAHRYGCPDIKVSVGETFQEKRWFKDWDGEKRAAKVDMVALTVEGEAPRVGNHEFLARVELHDGGNLVDTRPGVEDLDVRFRHADGYCDHCKTLRDRRDVFVVRNLDTGAQLQIGRNCLHDYLGLDNPTSITHRFAFFRAVAALEGDYLRGTSDWSQSLEGLLSLAAVCVRLFGWCSGSQAKYDDSLRPTAGYVSMVLNPESFRGAADRELIARVLEERAEADYATAREAIRWVREELKPAGEYEHNLKVLFNSEVIYDSKRLGIVVSAVAAYLREKEKALRLTKEREAAKKSQHVGKIGERLRNIKVTLQFQMVIGSNEWGDRVLVKFADENGNMMTWFTNKGTGREVGEQLLLTGTVKSHDEYNNNFETQLTRCALSDLPV